MESERQALIGGRFRLENLLKSGHGVQTWRSKDLSQGGEVALKMVDAASVPSAIRTRLQHEARVLQGLHGPAVTPLIDAGYSDSSFYLAVPWEAGLTLAERLRRGPLSVRETLGVAHWILTALVQAHESGVLHRDLKPSNIILKGGPDGVSGAVLIDFGFAHSVELAAALRDEPVGTVEYLSPEQAGLLEYEIDERSDLYSLGVVLFECLLGRPPFEGPTASEVLRDHLSTLPPALPPAVPHALDEAVRHLLQKEPRDRYQSARGALADFDRIQEALARGVTDPRVVIGLHDQRRALAEPVFVGRERELAALEEGVERARRGEGNLILLQAESGVGKTRLLDELEARCRRSTWVLRGQAFAEVAVQPFELFVGVVQGMLAAARSDKTLGHTLSARLGPWREAVCGALPDLIELLGPVSAELLGPEALGESRSLEALTTLFETLGTSDRPAVILLDDCQWADEGALKLLQHLNRRWTRATFGASSHVLVVASFRSEEVTAGHALRLMEGAPTITLANLDANEVRALVESMAGELPEQAVQVVNELSAGSPFMVTAVLRGMVECGALVSTGVGFRVETLELNDVRSSGQAAVFLGRRLARLPADTLQLLSVGAVLGREFEVNLAAALADFSMKEAMTAVAEARHRGILWTRAGDPGLVFVHDKLREALLARLSAADRQRLHLQAAIKVEAADPLRAFDIAYHFDAAGAPERALSYALAAGDVARSRHALAVAEAQYRIARRGTARGTAVSVQLRIAEGLGDVLMLRGQYPEAVEEFERARQLAESPLDRARLHGKLGELAFKRGDMDAAGGHVERGLRVLRQRVLRSRVALLAGFCLEILVQLIHTVLPRLFVARRPVEGAEAEFLAIHLYSRLAHISWFQRGNVATLWAHLREMNLAERYPPTEHLAQAYSEHAPAMTMVPWYSRGEKYGLRSLEIRRALGDVWGQGQSLHFLGVVLYAASRFEECSERCQEAVRLLERTGDRWEINTAQWHLAYCAYRLGQLGAAVKTAERVYQAGVDIGDAQARSIGLAVWSKASHGAVPAGLLATELGRESTDVHGRAELLQAEAVRLIGEHRLEQACGRLTEAQELVERVNMKQEYVAPILPWLATALRLRVESTPLHTPSVRRALLRQGLSVSWRAVWRARSYRNNLPHALRERALLLAMAGRARWARRCFDESLAWAERFHMREEAALTKRARGRVGASLGWGGAEQDSSVAQLELDALELEIRPRGPEAAVTVSLADRFDQILDAGRQISSGLTKANVYAAVRIEAARLLRADQCLILQITEPGQEVAPASAIDQGWFSRHIVQKALTVGAPVVLEEEAVPQAESVVLSGVRSVLCAPISVRGQIVACFYAAHHRVGHLFGPDELRLAEFIAALAGTALENAEGVASIEALSEERARRVEEAQEAVRARDEFLSIAAHELKTPLTSLGVQIAMLQRSVRGKSRQMTTEELSRFLDRSRRQVDRFQTLVARLLDVSRAVSGQLTIEPEELDLVEVVGDLLQRFADEATTAKSELILHAPEHLTGYWDRLRFDQVVSNLVTNALKFGAGHPVEVTLSGDPHSLRVTVQDRGIGIAPENQARIFERFERAVSSRHYGGFGLGLWITRQLVLAMGGTIRVESSLGQGALFVVELPRREAPGTTAREGVQ